MSLGTGNVGRYPYTRLWSPATFFIVTAVVRVRVTTTDTVVVTRVVVNGRAARVGRITSPSGKSNWYRAFKVSAHGENEAGNVEQHPHAATLRAPSNEPLSGCPVRRPEMSGGHGH
ncbi:hypothetical protein GobsT_08050 [Gemmata obscuriglobus]|nr:hypothetical protein GobsT_08050 [Gemmata obscuriglobus]VTS00493.1 unnamed protein product [Gemmata obscuriglobus UQM 2246]